MRSMKRSFRRYSLALAAVAMVAIGAAMPGSAAPQATYSVDNPIKINVMGEWAHPDDDTSIIGPCGVWHQRYGVRCGIIMITRGGVAKRILGVGEGTAKDSHD